jgi:hypothetical protein
MINQFRQNTFDKATPNDELRQINRQLTRRVDKKTLVDLDRELNELQRSADEIDLHRQQRTDALLSVSIHLKLLDSTSVLAPKCAMNRGSTGQEGHRARTYARCFCSRDLDNLCCSLSLSLPSACAHRFVQSRFVC